MNGIIDLLHAFLIKTLTFNDMGTFMLIGKEMPSDLNHTEGSYNSDGRKYSVLHDVACVATENDAKRNHCTCDEYKAVEVIT